MFVSRHWGVLCSLKIFFGILSMKERTLATLEPGMLGITDPHRSHKKNMGSHIWVPTLTGIQNRIVLQKMFKITPMHDLKL